MCSRRPRRPPASRRPAPRTSSRARTWLEPWSPRGGPGLLLCGAWRPAAAFLQNIQIDNFMTSARSIDRSLCSNFANFTELPSYIEVRLQLDNLERSSTWLDLRQTSHGGSLLVCLHSVTNPASHIAMAGKFPGGE